jgi:hypothetical protein
MSKELIWLRVSFPDFSGIDTWGNDLNGYYAAAYSVSQHDWLPPNFRSTLVVGPHNSVEEAYRCLISQVKGELLMSGKHFGMSQ